MSSISNLFEGDGVFDQAAFFIYYNLPVKTRHGLFTPSPGLLQIYDSLPLDG